MADYSTMTPQRTLGSGDTPAAPASDAIQRQAQNILALNETTSALQGGQNNFLDAGDVDMASEGAAGEGIGDFQGVTPARQDRVNI